MRLTMESPVGGAPGRLPEESSSGGAAEGQPPERSKYAKIDTASGLAGGLPGGAATWGLQEREEGALARRAKQGPRWRAQGSAGGLAAVEMEMGFGALRLCATTPLCPHPSEKVGRGENPCGRGQAEDRVWEGEEQQGLTECGLPVLQDSEGAGLSETCPCMGNGS